MTDRSPRSAEVLSLCTVLVVFVISIVVTLCLIPPLAIEEPRVRWWIFVGMNLAGLIVAWIVYRRLPSRW